VRRAGTIRLDVRALLPIDAIEDPLDRRTDHVVQADLGGDRQGCRRDLGIGAFAAHDLASCLYGGEAALCLRVVAEYVQWVFAGVQAVAANLDLAVDGVVAADLVLHSTTLEVGVEALI